MSDDKTFQDGRRRDLDSLEQVARRVATLERQRKWERVAAVILIFCLPGVAWFSSQCGSPERVVQAQRFLLTDSKGKVRAQLEVKKDATELALSDRNGVKRIVLVVEADGMPAIWLHNEKQNGQAQIALADGKYPFLEFWAPESTGPTLSLGVTGRGEAYLHIYDKEKQRYWNAP